jgi:hypothetical protein
MYFFQFLGKLVKTYDSLYYVIRYNIGISALQIDILATISTGIRCVSFLIIHLIKYYTAGQPQQAPACTPAAHTNAWSM